MIQLKTYGTFYKCFTSCIPVCNKTCLPDVFNVLHVHALISFFCFFLLKFIQVWKDFTSIFYWIYIHSHNLLFKAGANKAALIQYHVRTWYEFEWFKQCHCFYNLKQTNLLREGPWGVRGEGRVLHQDLINYKAAVSSLPLYSICVKIRLLFTTWWW